MLPVHARIIPKLCNDVIGAPDVFEGKGEPSKRLMISLFRFGFRSAVVTTMYRFGWSRSTFSASSGERVSDQRGALSEVLALDNGFAAMGPQIDPPIWTHPEPFHPNTSSTSVSRLDTRIASAKFD